MLIDKFFTEGTMSVHLKVGVPPMAKTGGIKAVTFKQIRNELCTRDELEDIADEFIDAVTYNDDAFEEMNMDDAQVYQIGNMRIAITDPPFSDDMEITVVRPTASLSFEDYDMSDELKTRIHEQRGVLIAGPPGAGKSTFAAGVASYLHNCGVVVKTMESPRDLQVPKAITQYGPLDGSMENTADVLLLVRPDYTIYDEVRRTRDFEVFADMRMAGVGMIGVVHANRAVDAIQRLIGRLELGVIPQVVDTVVFISKGAIAQVLTLEFTVKVPAGMMEQDLARPVILIKDFESGESQYELYTYGEQVVVMPLVSERKTVQVSPDAIHTAISKYAKGLIEVEMLSPRTADVYIQSDDMSRVIGRGGKTIKEIERALGVGINICELEVNTSRKHKPIIESTKKHVILRVHDIPNHDVDVYADEKFACSATVSRHGEIKIRSGTDIAESIMDAVDIGKDVWIIEN